MKKILFLLLLLGTLQYGNAQPATETAAQEAMFTAEGYYRKDSFNNALYGDGKNAGFLTVIKQYPNTSAANLANCYAGISFLQLGKYKEAITHLKAFVSPTPQMDITRNKLLGDAYADDNDQVNAFKHYKYAADQSVEKDPVDMTQAAELHFMTALYAEIVIKDLPAAKKYYESLVLRFPNSPHVSRATKFLSAYDQPIPGAARINAYLPLIKNKRVGIFANQTSMIGNTHLVDTLRKLGVKISVIFGPEHGFRGTADAGEKINNTIDSKTGIPVVSLYGTKRKASAEDLKNVDVLIFDIQDVGVRFYTYISSLEEFIETAIEFDKPLIVLDRPNPNGHYVDGPVLDMKYKSFVGMQPIPIVYGMTIGEYASMITLENWFNNKKLAAIPNDTVSVDDGSNKITKFIVRKSWINPERLYSNKFSLTIINCENYSHKTKYVLPVKPSPNLPNIQSIYLYPSTCLFEGTALSEGRGTSKQFQVFGHPSLPKNLYAFTPNPNEGAKNSKHYGKVCYGWDLSGTPEEVLKKMDDKIQLKWLLEAYKLFPQKDSFFLLPKSGNMEQSFFVKLSGNNDLWQQVKAGKSEEDIRKSWEPKLSEFKAIRKKYLLYEDFE